MGDAKVDASGLKRTFKDLFAGAAGGIAQVLLGEYVAASSALIYCSWMVAIQLVACMLCIIWDVFNKD